MRTHAPGDLYQVEMEAEGSWDTTQSGAQLVSYCEMNKKDLGLCPKWGQARTVSSSINTEPHRFGGQSE